MEKIKLSKDSKRILLSLYKGNYGDMVPEADLDLFNLLEVEGFVKSAHTKGDGHVELLAPRLTDEGRAYIVANPSLHNPSIWDDKKYIINTIISVVALAVAIIALFR
jgi:hypothetical protein